MFCLPLRKRAAIEMKSIAFLGKGGGFTAGAADIDLIVRSGSTARIQEAHKFLLHVLCEIVESALARGMRELIFPVFAAAIGGIVGSFLNVCIYRLPRGISLSNPRRSFCPSCKRTIPWYENVPVLSWIVLRGKCSVLPGEHSLSVFGG